MTPTEELAGLLRLAAEKEPEKFAYGFAGEREVAMLRGDPISTAIFIESLGEPEWFTLDHMDAIAGAVGYWFDVRHGCEWRAVDRYTSQWGICGKQPIDAVDWCPDKRTASLAALCAILQHRYGEGK